MYKQWKVVVATMVGMPMLWSMSAQAQEEGANVVPVELFACTYREGKGWDDLSKINERFAKWSKKHDDGYSAWTISPNFRANDGEFDIGWIGSWDKGGAAMGKGLDRWMKDNDGLAGAYNEVIDCSHSLVSSAPLNAADGPPDNGVVMFSSCTLEEGRNARESYAAHKAFSDAMREMGGKGQSWLMYPALGFGEMDFDYYHVTTFKSYEELGEGWNLYTNGKGYEKWGQMLDGLASCDSPRAYTARLVVGNER